MNKKRYLISTLTLFSLGTSLVQPVFATEEQSIEPSPVVVTADTASTPETKNPTIALIKTSTEQFLTLTGLTNQAEQLQVTLRNLHDSASAPKVYEAHLQADQSYKIVLDSTTDIKPQTMMELTVASQPTQSIPFAWPTATTLVNADDVTTTPQQDASDVAPGEAVRANEEHVSEPQSPASPARPQATVTISKVDLINGIFTVSISDIVAPNGIKELLVPVWGDTNGQNDLKWYTATQQADGSYTVDVALADHRHETGLFKAHVYLKQQDGSQMGVGATSVDIQPARPTGNLYPFTSLKSDGTMDIIITNVQHWRKVEKVLVPVWASHNGQDDLVWYEAIKQEDGIYRVSISAVQHRYQTGAYNVHVYYKTADGSMNFITSATEQITISEENRQKVSATASFANYDEKTGRFDILVRDVYAPNGVQKVLVPIWSEVNGQNDLKWYTATRQANGMYKVQARISDHHYELGTYQAHVYVVQQNNQQSFATKTSERLTVTPPTGTIEIKNRDVQQGRFEVMISDVSNVQGVKEVLVPVWAEENGQDDLVWYRATQQQDGTYRVLVEARNHRYQTGNYQAHVYYKQPDNRQIAVGKISTSLELQQQRPSATAILTNANEEAGTFDVIVNQLFAPKGFTSVLVPIWSTEKGQNDLRWYTATKLDDQTYKVSVKMKDHHYEQGEYNAHVYLQTAQGLVNVAQTSGLASTPMPQTNTPGWYKKNGVKYFYNNAGQLVGNGTSKKLIDVSRWQGAIDWNIVAQQGDIDGVIVSLGRGTTLIDQQTARNIRELNRLNIPYGVYLYTYATSEADAVAEARHTDKLLKQYGAKLSYPIFYDVENWNVAGQAPPPQDTETWVNIINRYVDEMKRLGYQNVNVYSYRHLLQTRLNHKDILKHVSWAAAYQPSLAWTNPYYSGMQGWQYTDKGSVPGIKGNVDLNVWYESSN